MSIIHSPGRHNDGQRFLTAFAAFVAVWSLLFDIGVEIPIVLLSARLLFRSGGHVESEST